MNKTLSNMIKVTVSNLFVLISGLFVSFVIPKLLGLIDYGYYKTFTLYATYIEILSFGFSEGIYLLYGGTDYSKLNKQIIRLYTKLFFLLQLFVSLIVAFIAIFFLKDHYRIIFIFLAIYIFELNITTYYQYIAQMSLRFKDYSLRNILRSIFTIFACGIMVLLYFINDCKEMAYYIYLVFVVSISTILLIVYISIFRDITFGKSEKIYICKDEIKKIFKLGIPFLISTICSTLILTIDRQFVSLLFETEEYSIYAFAYNLLSLVTVCTSAISTVLYPSLKATTNNDFKDKYPLLCSYIITFVGLLLISYYPLCIIIEWLLPKYLDSLIIFRIVFPGLIFSSVISVIMHNYYKLFEWNTKFFVKNIVILILSIFANIIAYFCFRKTEAISIASVIVLIIWYIYVEIEFVKKMKINNLRNLFFALTLLFGFYATTIISNPYLGFVVMLMVYLAVSLFFNHKKIFLFIRRRKK